MSKLLTAFAGCLIVASCSWGQNLQRTTLADNISSTTATTVSLYSSSIPASLSGGYLYIDSEVMGVVQSAQSISTAPANTAIFTVTRGLLGTTAATHNAGANVFYGLPSQFVAADQSGGCAAGSPQYLNPSDQKWFTCNLPGAWTAMTTNLSSSSVAGVSSFNSRTGPVVPLANDYSFAQLSGTTAVVTNNANTNFGAFLYDFGVASLGFPKGSTNPLTCATGQVFFNTASTAGQNLYGCTATNVWTQQAGGGGGSGTVTSVGLTTPSWLTVGSSPITSSGTLAVTPTTAQTSHQVIGTCGTATTFGPCALVAGDIPALSYQAPITLTTTGTSGAATLISNTLNIPQYTGGGGSGTVTSGTSGHITEYAATGTTVSSDANLDDGATTASTLTYTGTGGIVAAGFKSSGSNAGFFQLTQGTTNTCAASSLCFQAPTSISTSTLFTYPSAVPSGGQSVSWGTPSSGVSTGTWYSPITTLTTTGSSGAATLISGTLNIPQYTGGGSNTATFTVGTGGVTANLLVSKDTSNPTLVVAPAAGACGFGVAQSTVASGSSVAVQYNGIATVVADGTITAGHLLTGGSTTPGRVADTGQSSRSLVPSTTCVIGFAQASATVGGTLSIILTLPNDFGTQTTQIVDANNNATVKSITTASATNQVSVTNAVTGGTPVIAATGSVDTNIPLTIQGKGTGNLNLNGTSASVTPAGALTVASCSGCGSATVNAASLSNAIYCPDTSGTANTITCTTTTTYPAYAAGQSAIVKLANSVTGATTININSLGAKNVTKNGTTALASGDLVSGGLYLMTYDGTEYVVTQVLGGSGGSGTVNSGFANFLAYYPANGTAVSWTGAASVNAGGDLSMSDPSVNLPGSALTQTYTNDGTTGTAAATLVIVSATNTAKKAATSTTDGVIGVCSSGCGTTGNSEIAITGAPSLNLDNTGTPGHWVQISNTTAGWGHDAGATFPTSGGQVIGQVVGLFAGSVYNVALQLRGTGGSGGGLPDPGANGPVYRSALNTTAPATADNLSQPHTCIAASASGSSYTCTTSPTFTPATGDMLYFKADVASSSGTVTLNANSSSAFGIYKQGGGTLIGANDLLAGQWTVLIFDASNHWEMQGQSGNPAGAVWSSLTNPTTALTLTLGSNSTTFNTSAAGSAALTEQVSSGSAVAEFGFLGNVESWVAGTAGSAISGGIASSWFVKDSTATKVRFDIDTSGDVYLGNALTANDGTGSAMQVYANGHVGTRGTAPTLSSCGTSTLGTGSTDTAGYITFAGTPSTCTLTWATAYTARPMIVVSSESAVAISYTPSTTTLVITATSLTGVADYEVRALPN